MNVTLNEAETACLRKLAELHESGEIYWDINRGYESIALTAKSSVPVLRMLEQYGYIEKPVHTTAGWYTLFTINPSSVQAVRELELEKKKLDNKDIVESAKSWATKHYVVGWVLVAGSVLTIVITAVNQFVSLLKNLGAF